MKQSLVAGSIDNITCIIICFNNLKNIIQFKLTEYLNQKKEYSPVKERIMIYNLDDIRRRIFNYKEEFIELKKNENLNFFYLAFSETLKENKPKSSSENLKNQTKDEFYPLTQQLTITGNLYSEENEENQFTEASESNKNKIGFKIISKNNIPIKLVGEYKSNLQSNKFGQQKNSKISKNNLKKLELNSPVGGTTNINFFSNNISSNFQKNRDNLYLNKNSYNVSIEKFKTEASENLTAYKNYFSNRVLNNNITEEKASNYFAMSKKISINTSKNFFNSNGKSKILPKIINGNTKPYSNEKLTLNKFPKSIYGNFNSFSPISYSKNDPNLNTFSMNFQNTNGNNLLNQNFLSKNSTFHIINNKIV